VTEVSDNVDLTWIARNLVAARRDIQSLRDDVNVIAAILRRVDNDQAAFREELRAPFDLHRDLRGRLESIESER